jgi:hypothetical protein
MMSVISSTILREGVREVNCLQRPVVGQPGFRIHRWK